jgi:UDP-N-acetylglucosamine 4,6-dehydratase
MRIMITGVAGTLGKAFTKLLIGCHEVIGYDTNEWAVAEFSEEFPFVEIHLRDFSEWTYILNPCELIIHCAAYKHLPLGEQNVGPFIENNIIKTKKMYEMAKGHAEIIFISSDKAVEPISLYGMTKAIGEYLTKECGGYIARCGNFLRSSGSVIPVWEKAILERKPIKITDLRMKRFVIDVDDSAEQIWEGFKAGEHLIIPKCREIGLNTLLSEILQRHNIKKPVIKKIGIRPGEKMKEKLKWDWE